MNKAQYGRHQINWIRAFLECIREMREVEVLPIRARPMQMELFK